MKKNISCGGIKAHASRVGSYNRNVAVNYATSWAYSRNNNFANFQNLGGDCTNFASQVFRAGNYVNDSSTRSLYLFQ